MSFMFAGSLHSIISDSFQNGLPEPCIDIVFKVTLKVLIYLHEQRYFHGEIKAASFLVNLDGSVKSSSVSFHNPNSVQGTILLSRTIYLLHNFKLQNSIPFSRCFSYMIALCLKNSKEPNDKTLLKNPFFKNCKDLNFLVKKDLDFLVKNVLQGLAGVEERFRGHKIVLE